MTRVSKRQRATLSVHSTPAEIVQNIEILYHISYCADLSKNKTHDRFHKYVLFHTLVVEEVM